MQVVMAVRAKSDQVGGIISAASAPELDVVDLETFAPTTKLTPHPVAFQGGIPGHRVLR
jgi:hypothetical protein